MSASWQDEDEESKAGGAKGLGSRPRFSFSEIKMLLQEVRRNRYILLRKFNHGVSAEAKKQKWAQITDRINSLGQNHREVSAVGEGGRPAPEPSARSHFAPQVRQIMKKWADLKCDGKRRMALLRAPAGSPGRRKRKSLDSVEKMVHGILLMSPSGDAVSDADDDDDDERDLGPPGRAGREAGYPRPDGADGSLSLPGGAALDFSPLSSPDKELSGDPFRSSDDDADPCADFEDASASSAQSAPPKPVHTYSRRGVASGRSAPGLLPARGRPPPPGPPSSPSSCSSDRLPGPEREADGGAAAGLARLARHSVRQQRAGRQLLASASRSLEALAQSLQVLVESQQEFVSGSLALQRETLGVLKTFSGAALALLRDGRPQGPAKARRGST